MKHRADLDCFTYGPMLCDMARKSTESLGLSEDTC